VGGGRGGGRQLARAGARHPPRHHGAHYRLADLETGARRANELRLHLNQMLSNQPVEILAGNRVLEIRPHGIHKGRIVPPLPPERLARTTVVAIGDDRTDEDLFGAVPPEAISIRVGPGPTRARYRLESVAAVRALLQSLVDTGAGVAGAPPGGSR
jgi:trehalose 6-phosphate synthase/phosphatase